MVKLRFINPLTDTEQELFNEIEEKISNIEGILSASCTYDNNLYYFALYFARDLKVTISYYADKENNIVTSFIDSKSNNIIRIETFSNIDDIINVITTIMSKLLYEDYDDYDNSTAVNTSIK